MIYVEMLEIIISIVFFLLIQAKHIGQAASNAVAKGQRFRFFTPLLSASLKKTDSLITDIKNCGQKLFKYALNRY